MGTSIRPTIKLGLRGYRELTEYPFVIHCNSPHDTFVRIKLPSFSKFEFLLSLIVNYREIYRREQTENRLDSGYQLLIEKHLVKETLW